MRKLIVFAVTLTSIVLFSFTHASAASVAISGSATVVNTGGTLSFSSFNSNAVVDSETGNISGYVWSTDLGWIDFDNNGNPNSARIDLGTGNVLGQAYAINTGGLVDFTNFNSNVVVDLETGLFSGYGWSTDLGWINFSGASVPESSLLAATGKPVALPIVYGLLVLLGASQIKKITK